jgi:tRNA A37 threonylcarbamoyladenosine dehydratase
MTPALPAASEPSDADLERRFGGLRRLYGDRPYARLRAARVAVVGLGGVGSWAVEALARSGVAALWLIDLDQVSESNINRQVQALGATVGQAKAVALQQRIADIHPGCAVHVVEEFVEAESWPQLLAEPVDVVIDACDQVRAKLLLAVWGRSVGTPVVCVGAAGGKRLPQAVEVADLSEVSHDPLLATLRQRLRQQHGAPRGDVAGRSPGKGGAARGASIGLRCVFSRERGSLAQSVEQRTFNPLVACSSHARPTSSTRHTGRHRRWDVLRRSETANAVANSHRFLPLAARVLGKA